MSQGALDLDKAAELPDGVEFYPGFFDGGAQQSLVRDLARCLKAAPPFRPVMPRTGKPFSVTMSNCGPLGWVSDRAGYRYQDRHPDTGAPWPPLPPVLRELWAHVAPEAAAAEACLINFYAADAKMGSHQDRDEADFAAPVVSVSLGADAVFHIGGLTRAGPKARVVLRSGDVLVLGGASRLAFHGIDRVRAGTSTLDVGALVPGCCRINLTLRRVTKPD